MRTGWLLILAMLSATAWADDYEEGYDAYKRGDVNTAIRYLTMAASEGDARAAAALAEIHERGVGTRKDSEQATRWRMLANELRGSSGDSMSPTTGAPPSVPAPAPVNAPERNAASTASEVRPDLAGEIVQAERDREAREQAARQTRRSYAYNTQRSFSFGYGYGSPFGYGYGSPFGYYDPFWGPNIGYNFGFGPRWGHGPRFGWGGPGWGYGYPGSGITFGFSQRFWW